MKQAKSIERFIMGTAHYYVSGTGGDEAVLLIDYRNNSYALEKRGEFLDQAFEHDISTIAQDLLRRKHGVNFAEQLNERTKSLQGLS